MDIEQVMIHWRYFLSLERDVEILKNYVEIKDENFDTYSMEIFKVLQLACSEIDSVCRVLCKEVDPTTDYHDESTFTGRIDTYKKTIMRKFSRLIESEVLVPGLASGLQPWKDWQTKNKPDWWDGYNKAKHYRHSSYKLANLKNMLMAMSGLMIIIMYLYRLVENSPWATPSPTPKFFSSKYTSPALFARPDNELPDFE